MENTSGNVYGKMPEVFTYQQKNKNQSFVITECKSIDKQPYPNVFQKFKRSVRQSDILINKITNTSVIL